MKYLSVIALVITFSISEAKSNFYFEPYLGHETISWSADLVETQNDRYITIKTSGLMTGPKFGLKLIKFIGAKLKFGIDASYSILKSKYNESTSSSYDDSFIFSADASKINGNLLVGYQAKSMGISIFVSPMTSLNFSSGFLNISQEHSYVGTTLGLNISYLIASKINLNIDYAMNTYSALTVENTDYDLPREVSGYNHKEMETQEISISLSVIF